MALKILAEDEFGKKFLVNTDIFEGGINVVLENVPCESLAFVGAAMRMTNSGTAVRALADTLENSNVIGILESKSNPTTCNIRVSGVTADIFNGLDTTKEYFLSANNPGQITTSVPNVAGQVRLKLGQPYSDKRFLVLKGERFVRG